MSWKGFSDIQGTIIIDTTKTEEELLQKVDRSRRKNIKQALKENLEFVVGLEGDLEKWYIIYCKVWMEKGLIPENIDTFKQLNYKLYLIKKGQEILGGGVFIEFENKIVFKAYASLIEFQGLRVNDFLYWNSILYAKSKRKSVDLGGWQIKARGNLKGVNKFKEMWGGKIVIYKIYSKNPFYIIGRKLIRNSNFCWELNKKLRGRK